MNVNGIHRICANIKETDHELAMVVVSSASKTYFCSPCLSALPDALSSHSQLVNKLQTGFQSLENKLSKEIGGQIAAQFGFTCQKLQKSIYNLSLNFDELITQNSNIQMEIDNTSESINVPAQSKSYASAASPSNSALNIIDELADREKRRKNVIVYNFPEASDRKADIGSFLNMCEEVYNSDISVNNCKVVCSGKSLQNNKDPCGYVLNMMQIKACFSLNHIYYGVIVSIVIYS